jgi:hypothetical protein
MSQEQSPFVPPINTVSTDQIELLEKAHQLADGPLLTALLEAFEAGLKSKPDMLEDDEAGSQMRLILGRLSVYATRTPPEWFVQPSAEMPVGDVHWFDICVTERAGSLVDLKYIARHLTHDHASYLVLFHNNIHKIILLASMGLEARAARLL